ncbi:PREDICTED: uncharacterized protein LOC106813592 [Priapulus caudatus]|uniref:Uncharacterized protein LOC106813592 n=1 Tax=Priapulus caudatus TaxID=37621 RepID=A0ABM1EM34_PRICU|nr:PREDICTED: uncharacterized protein LOC106813592 [Priapulus caudatus]
MEDSGGRHSRWDDFKITEKEIAQAEQKRIAAKGWVTRERKKLTGLLEEHGVYQLALEAAIGALDRRIAAFEEVQLTMEMLLPLDKVEEDVEKTGLFMDIVEKVRLQASRRLASLMPPPGGFPDDTVSQSASPSSGARAQLPKLELPTFTGNLEEWLSFWDQFQALVYGMFLTPIILSRLPSGLRMEWARDGEGHESDLEFLLAFLKKEIERRERSEVFQNRSFVSSNLVKKIKSKWVAAEPIVYSAFGGVCSFWELEAVGISSNEAAISQAVHPDPVLRSFSESVEFVDGRYQVSLPWKSEKAKGFLSPFIMSAEILFREMWRLGVQWDDVLPDSMQHQFSRWVAGIDYLKSWKIPRCYSVAKAKVAPIKKSDIANFQVPDISTQDLNDREIVRQAQLERFWNVWTDDYLRNLSPAVKGFLPQCALKKGSVVLVREDHIPRLSWPLGIIVEVFPGRDGLIRSVKVKTAKGCSDSDSLVIPEQRTTVDCVESTVAMALQRLPPPSKLEFNSKTGASLANDWKKWREEFVLYAELALKEHGESEKIKTLKYLIGPEGREIYTTQRWEQEEEDRTIEIVLRQFDTYCQPKKNETIERFKFNMRVQGDETLEKFITDVKTLSQTCNFGDLADSLVRDKLVCGVKDQHLRERLLRTPELTLDKTIELARAAELTKQNVSTLDGGAAAEAEVHKVRYTQRKVYRSPDYKGRKGHPHKEEKPNARECLYCGKTHVLKRELCPAYGQICRKCHKPNHFEAKCESLHKGRNQPRWNSKGARQHINVVTDDYDVENYHELLVVHEQPRKDHDETCNSVRASGEIFAALDVGGRRVNFQVDSGATCNIIPKDLVPRNAEMRPTRNILRMFNRTTVTPMGKCLLEIHNPKNGSVHTADFVVVNEKCTPLIGNVLIQNMNLVTVQHQNILSVENVPEPHTSSDIVSEFADVFKGTGRFKGTYHLSVDPDVIPVVHPPRKVPIAIKDRLKDELDKLESMDVIAPVTEPTAWVSSMVTVVKPEKLRICIDPKDLNKALKRSHYPLPTIEEILPSLHNAKVFSVLDAKNGFWHVELDKESSLLTTFNTPFGRYRWLRLPFGISSAPEEYQRRQDQAVEGLPGVHSIVDDILVYGEGDSEKEAIADHDVKLRNLLERCRAIGLKLNKGKLRLRQKEVRFIGHLITAKGLKPDPAKVKAVTEMPEPTDVAGVRRFIGFVTYLSKFLPGLSDQCEPLRKLTQQDMEWCWLETHSNAVREIKRLVTSQPVLRYFNAKEEVTLQCDASEKGLGAALLQNGQPVAFASRALTDVETRYAQIEKELLAVVFGLERFHHYTYGRQVTVQSNHKPLEKSLHSAPKRLQRMLLRLQRYTYTVMYHPGKSMYLADTLSRAFLVDKDAQL